MGSWVSVTEGVDSKAIQDFGREVCIEGTVTAHPIDSDGDGRPDQVMDIRPSFTADSSALDICMLGKDEARCFFGEPLPVMFRQTNACAPGSRDCVPAVTPAERIFVGNFIPGESGEQIAVVMADGAVQLFKWEPGPALYS
ncbi:MAG: hypothetical protein WC956_01690 [bacterium]